MAQKSMKKGIQKSMKKGTRKSMKKGAPPKSMKKGTEKSMKKGKGCTTAIVEEWEDKEITIFPGSKLYMRVKTLGHSRRVFMICLWNDKNRLVFLGEVMVCKHTYVVVLL